jgi:hypothetical protein
MPVDLNEQLTGQLTVLAQLVFQKDLFQGGQGETANILAALNSADRTPVIKK